MAKETIGFHHGAWKLFKDKWQEQVGNALVTYETEELQNGSFENTCTITQRNGMSLCRTSEQTRLRLNREEIEGLSGFAAYVREWAGQSTRLL